MTGFSPYLYGREFLFRIVRRDGLAKREALFAPLIEQDDSHQYQTTQKISSQHVTCPVLAQVNARHTNQKDEAPEESQQKAAYQRSLEQGIGQIPDKTKKANVEHDVSARETVTLEDCKNIHHVYSRARTLDNVLYRLVSHPGNDRCQ